MNWQCSEQSVMTLVTSEMSLIHYRLLRQVATGRKSALMTVIGCRTDKTDLAGVMEDASGYENLHVFSEIKQYVSGYRCL